MKPIFVKAPLRLSLAGGGSDIPAFSNQYGGAVVSVTINRFAYTVIEPSDDGTVVLIAADQHSSLTFPSRKDLDSGKGLPLHVECLRYFLEKFSIEFKPLKITTYCDSPVGAGLGASSTITVSMVYGLSKFFGYNMSQEEIAETAFQIERIRCGMAGGKQDQFSAAFGGMNLFEFNKDGSVKVKRVHLRENFAFMLQTCLLTCYSGKSRVSSKIITSQTKGIIQNDKIVVPALQTVRDSAYEMTSVLQSANLNGVVEVFRKNWESKKKTSQDIAPERLTNVIEKALNFGAWAGKVSGAGGGGFLMFWVPIQKRKFIIDLLEANEMTVYNCDFCKNGVLSWTLD